MHAVVDVADRFSSPDVFESVAAVLVGCQSADLKRLSAVRARRLQRLSGHGAVIEFGQRERMQVRFGLMR